MVAAGARGGTFGRMAGRGVPGRRKGGRVLMPVRGLVCSPADIFYFRSGKPTQYKEDLGQNPSSTTFGSTTSTELLVAELHASKSGTEADRTEKLLVGMVMPYII